jgi:hypothetical protein
MYCRGERGIPRLTKFLWKLDPLGMMLSDGLLEASYWSMQLQMLLLRLESGEDVFDIMGPAWELAYDFR